MSKNEIIQLEDSWKEELITEFSKPYMRGLKEFLQIEKELKKVVYPKGGDIFKAFAVTPLPSVKVVILGQDPYHGLNQAHGMCFSVLPGVRIPSSLINIYKELESDLSVKQVNHGYLGSWAQQGVFLLNSILTVEHGKAASHQNKGWEQFTDQVINVLNKQSEPIIFVLWGSYAHKKGQFIDAKHHLVLKSVHPSPLSAHRGFFGCKHFSKINTQLRAWNKKSINWQLPEVPVVI